jgi:hypothetical protein
VSSDLDHLLVRLEAARLEFSNDERKGASTALDALCDYLRVVSDDIGLRAPLIALMAALGDLDRGITPPIVKANVKENRHETQKPTFAAMDWAAAAVALTLAREARIPDALGQVARAAGVEKEALGEMLRNINRRTAPANTRQHYADFLAIGRSYKDLTPKDRAARAISHLRDTTNIR